MTERTPTTGDGDAADTVRVVVEPENERVQAAVAEAAFRRYLRRAHEGRVEVGDEWVEFVATGCGTRTDATIRVVNVEEGELVGNSTEFAFE